MVNKHIHVYERVAIPRWDGNTFYFYGCMIWHCDWQVPITHIKDMVFTPREYITLLEERAEAESWLR